jgi:hypothetical protein
MSTSVSSLGITPNGESLHARFEAPVPRIQRHGEVYFRHVNCPVKKSDHGFRSPGGLSSCPGPVCSDLIGRGVADRSAPWTSSCAR